MYARGMLLVNWQLTETITTGRQATKTITPGRYALGTLLVNWHKRLRM